MSLDEDRYAERMLPHRERWKARASELERGGTWSLRRYAASRVASLSRPYAARLVKCATVGLIVKCGCHGKRDVRWFTCRQHLACERCQRTRSRQLGQRVRAGLEVALAGAPPGTKRVLLTLTLRHSGDVAADRDALAAGWRKFYKRMHKAGWGKFPYVGVWEVTPGADGLGHVHMHVAVFWPWLDWGVIREMWLASCPQSERITLVARRRDGRESTPESMANYLGKYLSKGLQPAEFSPQLRADVLAASYQARWVFASRGFWQPWVPNCPGCNMPRVKAQYRWHGEPYRPERPEGDSGHRQVEWSFPTAHERAGPGCS